MRLQEKENTTIPLMQKQLAEIHQSINNLVKAMEMGIVSRETKQRFEELEAQRTELETDIIKQEIQEEIITREQVVEWLKEMKRLDLSLDDSKRKLVDTFVNSVYLYDDKVVIIFNCREGASTLALPLDDTSACMRIGEPDLSLQEPLLALSESGFCVCLKNCFGKFIINCLEKLTIIDVK